MGRVRGKGRKQTMVDSNEAPVRSEEEKPPAYKRRGRPTKALKDGVDEDCEKDESVETTEEDETVKAFIFDKSGKNEDVKRRRSAMAKENFVKEENCNGSEMSSNVDVATKSVGYRQNGNRRKNKPRRAAEVGVECVYSSSGRCSTSFVSLSNP